MTGKAKSFRYMWMIPLVMMVLAMLACDEVYVPPPMVDRVEADTEAQGRAYARVVNVGLNYNSVSNGAVGEMWGYETNDYGANWQPSKHMFAETAVNTFGMEMYDEQLHFNGYSRWSFPRSVYRGIFYESSGFELPQGHVSNGAQEDVVYVAMGTQGVFVAHLDGDGFASDWKIVNKGIDALTPLPLSFTQPSVILSILIVILVVPPFALIHAYLLQRVWLYVLPPDEARATARKVTACLVVFAIIGIVFWLTNDRIDLYEVIAVLTALTVIVGVVVTVLLAKRAQVTDFTRIRLAVTALGLSLIVPGGVAAIFAMWWLVFGIVFFYWAYQRAYWRFIPYDGLTPEGRTQRWRVDRLAIEMIVIIAVGCASIIFQVELIRLSLLRKMDYGGFLGLALGIAGLYFVIRHYSSQRAKAILRLNDETLFKRELRLMSGDLWMHTIFGVFWTVVATIVTLFLQSMAYSWFTTLLTSTISRG